MKRFKDYLEKSNAGQVFLTEGWKAYDPDVAYLYQQDFPISSIKTTIESSFGSISCAEIYRSLERNGIRPNRRQKPYHDNVLYFGHSGMELDEISKLTGYSVRQVRNILNSNTI